MLTLKLLDLVTLAYPFTQIRIVRIILAVFFFYSYTTFDTVISSNFMESNLVSYTLALNISALSTFLIAEKVNSSLIFQVPW